MHRRVPSNLISAALVAALAAGFGPAEALAKKKKADREESAHLHAAPGAAAALVGDEPITIAEIDALAAGRLMKVRQQEYEVRSTFLENLISDRLLDREAAARGVSREQLLRQEVTATVPDPSDAEIESYYNSNRGRYGAQTLDQVQGQIISILRSRELGERQRAYIRSLREKHGVRVLLEPPRVDVAHDDDAFRGPADAPVTIVAFSDYQCPYCSRAEATIDAVMEKYKDSVRLVYRDYPLSFHKNAQKASEAAECAEEQGRFWEMHRAMFANQSKLETAQLVETAAGLGLESERFKECLDSGKYSSEVQNDFNDGQRYGVTGTPTFFINGIMMVGAKGVDAFSAIIDQELSRAAD